MLTLLAATALSASPILHYVRSNLDGSEPEHVVHYRPTRTGIAVYKWVSKCTTAAYVTAEMGDDLLQGRIFFAGKVAKDGTQARFGTLTFDPQLPSLVADVTPPGGQQIQVKHQLRAIPFLLYDFDFADLNAIFQEHRDEVHFSFELPVIWPADGPTIFRDYGTLHITLGGEEVRLGRPTKRFDLGVVGEKSATGAVWVDAAQGYIVEAELGLPNHLEYKDFRLKLSKVEDGSQTAWDALTKGHYANCPAT